MNHRASEHPVKQFLNRYPQLLAYALVIFVFFFALWLNNRNANSDEKLRCVAAVDSRNVDRDQTERLYVLAMSFVPSPEKIKELPPVQRKRVNAYKEQVADFRDQSFATIKPSPLCAPYVTDDHVTPKQWEDSHPPKTLTSKK